MPRCKRCQAGTEHDFRHGTVTGYRNHGCRCMDCKAAASDYSKARRQERPELYREISRRAAKSYYHRNKSEIALRRQADEYKRGQLARYRRRNSENREVLAERARRRRERADVQERNSSIYSAWRQRNRAYVLERQKHYRDTVRSAVPVTRTGRYTVEEDLLVSRSDLSIREMAYQLGRSYGSVTERRRRLRKEQAEP